MAIRFLDLFAGMGGLSACPSWGQHRPVLCDPKQPQGQSRHTGRPYPDYLGDADGWTLGQPPLQDGGQRSERSRHFCYRNKIKRNQ